MDIEQIDRLFEQLMNEPNVHRILGLTSSHTATIRYMMKKGQYPSIRKRVHLLQKSGRLNMENSYTRNDMLDLIRFILRQGVAARNLGELYLFDKFKASR